MRRWSWLLLLSAPLVVLACSGGGEAAGPSTTAASGSFCDAWAALDNSDLSEASGDEADFDQLVESGRSLFDTLRDTAPAEVHDEAVELASAYGTFADYLRSVGYDVDQAATAPADVQSAMSTLTFFDQDGSPLGAYVEANCGVELPHSQFSSIEGSL